jgi:hypothetical protein
MTNEILSKIESAIAKIQSGHSREKVELVELLTQLKSELSNLSESHIDDVRSVAHFTEAATHEFTRQNSKKQLRDLSLAGISQSVKGLEISHPKLVAITNEICMMFARMGI